MININNSESAYNKQLFKKSLCRAAFGILVFVAGYNTLAYSLSIDDCDETLWYYNTGPVLGFFGGALAGSTGLLVHKWCLNCLSNRKQKERYKNVLLMKDHFEKHVH